MNIQILANSAIDEIIRYSQTRADALRGAPNKMAAAYLIEDVRSELMGVANYFNNIRILNPQDYGSAVVYIGKTIEELENDFKEEIASIQE